VFCPFATLNIWKSKPSIKKRWVVPAENKKQRTGTVTFVQTAGIPLDECQLSETATLCGATFLFKNLIHEKCFLFLVAEIPVGCSQQEKDKDIKKIITVKAKG
jgi:hypothetical protein